VKNLENYQMLRIQAFLGNNDVMAISEALKEYEIGGLTVSKVRGRGKRPPPEIHASKGSAIFQPQFSQKYVVELVIPENKEEQVINILKDKGTVGKIFVSPVLRAIDIATGAEGESVI
jgi:nitrogen regulatory protein P-II 1